MITDLKTGDFVVVKETNKMLWGTPPTFPMGQILRFEGNKFVVIRNFSVLNNTTDMKLTIKKRHIRTSLDFIDKLKETHPLYKEYMRKVQSVKQF